MPGFAFISTKWVPSVLRVVLIEYNYLKLKEKFFALLGLKTFWKFLEKDNCGTYGTHATLNHNTELLENLSNIDEKNVGFSHDKVLYKIIF